MHKARRKGAGLNGFCLGLRGLKAIEVGFQTGQLLQVCPDETADVFTENRMPFTVFHPYEGVVVPMHLQAAVQHSHPAAVMAWIASRFLGSMSLIMFPKTV